VLAWLSGVIDSLGVFAVEAARDPSTYLSQPLTVGAEMFPFFITGASQLVASLDQLRDGVGPTADVDGRGRYGISG